MKIKYIGNMNNAKIRFLDGSDKKISFGEIIEIDELNWENLSKTGNFIEFVTNSTDVNILNKKKNKKVKFRR